MLPGGAAQGVIDAKFPVSQGMKTSDVVKSMLGLLSLGKSDFEAIEPFRGDRFFKEALGLTNTPSAVWLRQRLNAKAAELRELTDELTLRLLEHTEAPITPHKGYICADLDTFVMDQPAGRRTPRSGGPERSEGFGAAEHKKGQSLLVPDIEIEGWWTSLTLPMEEVIDLYEHHGAHEQFHSEIKTDLDLERLPSGKFDTNDAILHLASFAYNCLRLLGQLGLTGEIAPIRHPAKRRRLKTVLQEIMYRAAKFIAHARKLVLDFGRGVAAHAQVFIALQERLWRAASG